MSFMRRSRPRTLLRSSAAAVALAGGVLAGSASASADSTEDYPIPHRMIVTNCTAEQILAAARDYRPIYYERYMIDYHNKSPQIEQAAQDRIHWFYAQTPAQRRAYSEEMATNIYVEPLTFQWPNWAKIFFNNKGVAARTTDVCEQYPAGDMSVWDWSPAPR